MKNLSAQIVASFAAIIMLLAGTSCSTVNSSVYTKGAVYTAYVEMEGNPSASLAAFDEVDKKTIYVKPFIDFRNKPENFSKLWLCTLPIASVFSSWEKGDWLQWDSRYAGYKRFDEDLHHVISVEINQLTDLKIVSKEDEEKADFSLEGGVRELTFTQHTHFLGTSYVIGEVLGVFGLPMGRWDVSQILLFRLVDNRLGEVVWEKEYCTSAKGTIAMYYGKNPMSHGYPYGKLLHPVLADISERIQPLASGDAK